MENLWTYKSSKVDFIQTTILSIRNEGSTPIIREQSTKVERTQKYAISASSSLSGAISGNLKGFKLGLDRKINIKADATITISQVENQSTKITIDPMTMLNIYVIGKGRLTNGVASRYLFFIRTHQGGYEYINITSLYYRMEKKNMTKILFIISGLLILGAIIAIIITNKETVSDKIITIQTENNYLYTESKRVNFRIYTNKKNIKFIL